MLGFSKKGRAKKELLAAFEVVLIGRKDDRTEILNAIENQMPALSDSIMNGANPYDVAGKVVQDHILATLKKSSQEERVALLKCIADHNYKKQPHIFELISHVNYCLTILEDESKPLIAPGSAAAFVTTISKWFADNERLLHRVVVYFEESTQFHRYKLQQTRRRNERKYR